MNLFTLFPTAIGFSKLPEKLTEEQLTFINNQPLQINHGNMNSVNNYILNSKELDALHKNLLQVAREYFKLVYAPAEDVDVYITQSWVNLTEPGRNHHIHSHPNSFLSGVFYIQADNQTDKIVFRKITQGGVDISLEAKEWNLYNSGTWSYPVNTGDVIVFPSNLQHEVPFTNSSHNRISLAFNVFLKGRLGNGAELTELKL